MSNLHMVYRIWQKSTYLPVAGTLDEGILWERVVKEWTVTHINGHLDGWLLF